MTAEVRYVVLSDLHFGATNSLLTSVRPDASVASGFRAEPDEPTALLEAFLAGLASLWAGQDAPPTLVLAGDVLDLALSPDEVAATAFGGFVDHAFGAPTPLFRPCVYYVPGNHDHHLWEGTREISYASALWKLPPDQPLPPPRHTTTLCAADIPASEGDLLSILIRRRLGCARVELRAAYPNLALTTETRSHTQIVSHGHFIEPIYTLMSRLRYMLFPDQGPERLADVETVEAENFAWIDFFWSTLGRSGDVGLDVARIYADLQSTANLDQLAGNLVAAFVARPGQPRWLRGLESLVLTRLLRREVNRVARAERASPDVALTEAGWRGLRRYLEEPVATQLRDELGGIPEVTGFVFGHTHKPFAAHTRLTGYDHPVHVANTGGWVVDTATPAVCQGGAAVLLDDDLNAALLQLYRQRPGGVEPVRVVPPAFGPTEPNPLAATLCERIDPEAAAWKAITNAAQLLVAERWQLQANLSRTVARDRRTQAATVADFPKG